MVSQRRAGYAQRQPVPLTSGSLIVEPDPSPSSPAAGVSVNGAYAYTVGAGAIRRGSVTAHFDDGPVGEWSQTAPATGGDASFGGPVTCLEVDGPDAWLAGPATRASDGATDRAALLYVHDGGPDGRDDAAMLWMNDPGQTLQTRRLVSQPLRPGRAVPAGQATWPSIPGGSRVHPCKNALPRASGHLTARHVPPGTAPQEDVDGRRVAAVVAARRWWSPASAASPAPVQPRSRPAASPTTRSGTPNCVLARSRLSPPRASGRLVVAGAPRPIECLVLDGDARGWLAPA